MPTQVKSLEALFASGALLHPYLGQEYFSKDNRAATVDSFVDLSASIAMCCGAAPPRTDQTSIQKRRMHLAAEIGGNPTKNSNGKDVYPRKHIVLILCDGMGNSCLESAFASGESSFLVKNNQSGRLRAVFPSTTPAALTSLATASFPGRHGMPGWNLRDKSGCDFPGNNDAASPAVQLLVLSDHIRDARSGELATKVGFDTWDKVFVEVPWSRSLLASNTDESGEANPRNRKMVYINAYNGDDYQNWSQGGINDNDTHAGIAGTDFSSWQMGNDTTQDGNNSSLFDTAKIEETAYDTLGQPKGSADAIRFFRNGVNAALAKIAHAERCGHSTFTYLYTAHPDKHMHALGVENDEVKKVIRGLDNEIKRFWKLLDDRDALLAMTSFENDGLDDSDDSCSDSNNSKAKIDATIVVTADHGHVTVEAEHMVTLPPDILECLEYANIGVHGKVSLFVPAYLWLSFSSLLLALNLPDFCARVDTGICIVERASKSILRTLAEP